MDKRYDYTTQEQVTYDFWQEKNVFNPDNIGTPSKNKSGSKSFTIMMPPPNANDPLHIGHAMFIALEDILIRFNRMIGSDTLWIPGTDHAGIETQFVFEKKLKKKGESRFQFDRETLYNMIWDYVQENSDVAVNQMKKIGASADWSRFMFMLDEKNVDVVVDTFLKLHKDKLLYRDLRLVNFCTNCGTAYSELEVDYVDQTTSLYYVKYPMADNPDEYITIATVRPEPIWADTHLVVHPDNPKTQHLIGKKVLNPLTNAEMKIIADEFVDPEFGTGIVKLTPAHDHNDFDVAKKHNLPIVEAITTQGKIHNQVVASEAGAALELEGLKVKAAREKVVEILQEKDLIEKIDEKYENRVPTCYRCKRQIEILPLPQFFIEVEPLTKPILKALKDSEFIVHGAGHDKILKHWLENLKDWNISRQIVWGIRMPVWYKVDETSEIRVTFLDRNQEKQTGFIKTFLREGHTLEEISKGLQELFAPKDYDYTVSLEKPGEDYIQETDTFDTWFSSAQWPFSTLQALDAKAVTGTDNFKRFYPTQVMETGYDILPFWVMRMLMMGKYKTGKLPFTDVYLHGLVRDQKGKKMSKSKGNVINPLEIIEKYGADALRMALVIRSSAGLDKSVGEPDFKAMRNLGNKIWNASRFVTMLHEWNKPKENTEEADTAFEAKLHEVSATITKQLEDFKIGLAAETVYNEFWHWFCDESIENAKDGKLSLDVLTKGLVTFLQLLHPFTPFVTEAVWQELQKVEGIQETVPSQVLALSEWPVSSK